MIELHSCELDGLLDAVTFDFVEPDLLHQVPHDNIEIVFEYGSVGVNLRRQIQLGWALLQVAKLSESVDNFLVENVGDEEADARQIAVGVDFVEDVLQVVEPFQVARELLVILTAGQSGRFHLNL